MGDDNKLNNYAYILIMLPLIISLAGIAYLIHEINNPESIAIYETERERAECLTYFDNETCNIFLNASNNNR